MKEIITNTIPTTEIPLSTDSKQSSERFGHYWEVVDQRSDFGGQIIRFRFKEIYLTPEHAESKSREIFPALEHTVRELTENDRFRYKGQLVPFGYSYWNDTTGFHWEAPDKTSLEARFEKYKQDHPELGLKSLKILSSEGTATDQEFVQAYISDNDALLSDGKEFIHDQHYHVMRTLGLLLQTPQEYYKSKQVAKEQISVAYERIANGEKLQLMTPTEIQKLRFILSVFVDGIWTVSQAAQINGYLKNFATGQFLYTWEDKDYRSLWSKHFPDEIPPNMKELKDLWGRSIDLGSSEHP